MQSSASANSAPSSTGSLTAKTTKLLQPSKTSSIKTKSSSTTVPLTSLHNGSGLVSGRVGGVPDLQTSLEIEEISKKISEHADALYRTWKSHGIAPTEILDIYTAEAAAATGSITEDVKSTEGLHKLVNSFVIKDKEQRGVKTTNSKTSGSGLTKSATQTQTQKKARSPSPSKQSAAINNSSSTTTTTAILKGTISSGLEKPGDGMRKSTPSINSPSSSVTNKINSSPGKNVNPPAFLLNNKSSRLGDSAQDGMDYAKPNTTPTPTTTTKFKSQKQLNDPAKLSSTATKPLDLNFDISLDLNLDIPALTLQQTENLKKIKELLQQETPLMGTAGKSGVTKIPSVIIEKSPQATKLKEVKVKKSPALDGNKKSAINSPLGATLMEDSASRTNETATKVQRKTPTSSVDSAPQITIKKIGNKTKSSNRLSSEANLLDTLDNAQTQIIFNQATPITAASSATTAVIDKSNRKSDKNRDTSPSSSATKKRNTSATAAAAATTVTNVTGISSSPLLFNGSAVTDNSNDALDNRSLSKSLKTADAELNVKQIVSNAEPLDANASSASSSSQKLQQKSITKSAKANTTKSLKEKSKESAIKLKTPKEDINEITTAAVEAGDPSNMEVARSNGTTGMGSSMLTPTKLKSTRPLTNGQEKSVKSPFLTRGSVAERVLMFEKCPDVRNSFLNIKRPDRADAPPKSLLKAKLHATPPQPPADHTALQREIRSTKSVYIPRFYFPHGKPQPTIALERTLRTILSAFDTFPNNQVTRDELPRILKICGLPFYWRMPVMVFCQQGNSGLVERQRFVEFWKQMNVYCHDEASRFVYILSRGQRMRTYILPEDMAPLVQDVVDTHPGLAFLKEATEFHSRYVHTVIARIFYNVNRSWSGRISISELKKSDLLEIIALLEEEDDINQIMAFFSYEHFYVIYCKFWELDKDHDLLISQDDLARHSDHALSTRIVDRIFSGCVTRTDNKKNPDDEPKMSYTDFVWFLLSEEDKRTPTAIEYWFRCMDMDGDGVLSMYELEYFYEEQQQRMESIGIESLPFEDCLCQMLDMIKPKRRDGVTLSDLKNCKMTHVFFDTFFNLEKYLDHEQRDPFASQRDEYTSDWDRFAAQEYELLITEEND